MNAIDFDPDGPGQDNGNYFGLPFAADDAEIVLLSVPWDVTSSYGDGACRAPEAIIRASTQLDLYEPLNPGAWRRGIGTVPVDRAILERSVSLRSDAVKVMERLEHGGSVTDKDISGNIERVNEASRWLNREVLDRSLAWLDRGKTVGLVGGDHSTPFGLVEAMCRREKALSVLHIDAHADLRERYEGFTDSHASIMFNVLDRLAAVEKLVQVGVRDLCDSEAELAARDPRVRMFTDWELASRAFEGRTWAEQCAEIVDALGEKVYVSFDIDGLSRDHSPHTGTPVPGGLSFNRAVYLMKKVVESGRRMIGFDLCEVSPGAGDEWDANVGARVLYKMCCLALRTKQT